MAIGDQGAIHGRRISVNGLLTGSTLSTIFLTSKNHTSFSVPRLVDVSFSTQS